MKQDTYNHFYLLAQDRYSCRAYSDRPVSRDTIIDIMDVVRLAPSACNKQPWTFLIADSQELRDAVMESYPREWMASAPIYIVACGAHNEAWHRRSDSKDHTDVDVSIAIEHLCLAATSLGLATCWVCNFDAEKLREAFAIPEGIEPIALIPLGYPAEGTKSPEKMRKSLDEIVKWGPFD